MKKSKNRHNEKINYKIIFNDEYDNFFSFNYDCLYEEIYWENDYELSKINYLGMEWYYENLKIINRNNKINSILDINNDNDLNFCLIN